MPRTQHASVSEVTIVAMGARDAFPIPLRSFIYGLSKLVHVSILSTGRDEAQIKYIEEYLKAAGLFRDYNASSQDPTFSHVLELDLSTVVPSVSGPKRPHDRISVSDFKQDFKQCLTNKVFTVANST